MTYCRSSGRYLMCPENATPSVHHRKVHRPQIIGMKVYNEESSPQNKVYSEGSVKRGKFKARKVHRKESSPRGKFITRKVYRELSLTQGKLTAGKVHSKESSPQR